MCDCKWVFAIIEWTGSAERGGSYSINVNTDRSWRLNRGIETEKTSVASETKYTREAEMAVEMETLKVVEVSVWILNEAELFI